MSGNSVDYYHDKSFDIFSEIKQNNVLNLRILVPDIKIVIEMLTVFT